MIVLLMGIYIIEVVQHHFFLFRLACHILNLSDIHGITLIPAYITAHLNVEDDYHKEG